MVSGGRSQRQCITDESFQQTSRNSEVRVRKPGLHGALSPGRIISLNNSDVHNLPEQTHNCVLLRTSPVHAMLLSSTPLTNLVFVRVRL